VVLQRLVDRADDVRDHRSRRVEDATLQSLLSVVLLEKGLIEMDDWVFLRVSIAEVSDYGLHLGLGVVEQLHDLTNTELVKVQAGFAGFALAAADAEKGLHQIL